METCKDIKIKMKWLKVIKTKRQEGGMYCCRRVEEHLVDQMVGQRRHTTYPRRHEAKHTYYPKKPEDVSSLDITLQEDVVL